MDALVLACATRTPQHPPPPPPTPPPPPQKVHVTGSRPATIPLDDNPDGPPAEPRPGSRPARPGVNRSVCVHLVVTRRRCLRMTVAGVMSR